MTKRATKVRGSTTGKPVMRLLDLLGRRWALRVLWELRDEPLGFRELQARCGDVSPSSLSQRLADLSGARLVAVDEAKQYAMTREGRELVALLLPLHRWAEKWARR